MRQGEEFCFTAGEFVLSVFFLAVSVLAYREAMSMTSGTWYAPSVFPKLTSIVMALLSTYVGVNSFKKVSVASAVSVIEIILNFIRHSINKSILFMVLMFFFLAFIMPLLHFVFATVIFLSICMLFYSEEKSPKRLFLYLLYSCGFVTFSIVVFKSLFGVILP